MNLFEYAVIRIVPQVEREEFLNVGVILFCKRQKFVRVKWMLKKERFACFSNELDLEIIAENLTALELIAAGDKKGGPMACEEAPERFRWLTAVRSSVIQTSRPHPGKCLDLDETLNRLFDELVG